MISRLVLITIEEAGRLICRHSLCDNFLKKNFQFNQNNCVESLGDTAITLDNIYLFIVFFFICHQIPWPAEHCILHQNDVMFWFSNHKHQKITTQKIYIIIFSKVNDAEVADV